MKYSQTIRYFKPIARVGYFARGLVYLVIGGFAAMAAVGGGQSMSSSDAIRTLMGSGYGTIMAIILVVGLAAFAIWRFLMGVFTDQEGNDGKALVKRGAYIVSTFVYLGLAYYAYTIWSGAQSSGSGSGGGGSSPASTIASFIGSTAASALLALAFLGYGFGQFYKAFKETYAEQIRAGAPMHIVHPIAKTGLFARGIVFVIVGGLFVYRAVTARSASANGGVDTSAALDFIWSLPFGTLLLAAIGIGLVCFAAFCFVQSIYRRINVEKVEAAA